MRSKWNGNRFSIYTSEEKSTLGLLEEMSNQTNYNTDMLDTKTDLVGDHKGSWQGLNKPTLSEEGMRATVEKLETDMIKVNGDMNDLDISVDNRVSNAIDLMNINLATVDKRYKVIKEKSIYVDDILPSPGVDIAPHINAKIQEGFNRFIFTQRTYNQNTQILVDRRINFEGNQCEIKTLGNINGFKWFLFTNPQFMVTGSTIKDIRFTGRGANYKDKCFEFAQNRCLATFEKCIFTNYDISILFPTQSFGHRIVDCEFWGMGESGVLCFGNAEQVVIEHCWFDGGDLNTLTNSAIAVTDASSFLIVDTVIQNVNIGVRVKGWRQGSVRNCHFENCIHHCVEFYCDGSYQNIAVHIDNNLFNSGRASVIFKNHVASGKKSIGVTISNNFFDYLNPQYSQFYIWGEGGSYEQVALLNNSSAGKGLLYDTNNFTTIKTLQ